MHSQSSIRNDLEDFLTKIDLVEYLPFVNDIPFALFKNISDAQLEVLGVKIRLHRVKILDALQSLQTSQNTEYTDLEISINDSQHTSEINDISVNSFECILLRGLSGYLEGESFIIGDAGVKIGRGSAMEIMIPDGFISRRHCEIIHNPISNEFLLCDTGSTTGTFVKISGLYPLSIGTMFQTGTCEFKVTNITYTFEGTPSTIELLKYEGPEAPPLTIFSGGYIGRSKSCEISIENDRLLSQTHAKISLKHNCFCLEDLNSCNSTWIRLSPEGEFSEEFPLASGDLLKIGTAIFLVEPYSRTDKTAPNLCKTCKLFPSTIEVLPCAHKFCMDCASKMKFCLICQRAVKEILRGLPQSKVLR